VRAPKEQRSLDEIVDEALKEIAPPTEARDEWRAKIASCIEWLQREPREPFSLPEIKARIAAHVKALRAVRRTAIALGVRKSETFVAQVDDELLRMSRAQEFYATFPKNSV
jgi:hypothetical protein